MKKVFEFILMLSILLSVEGCAQTTETAKVIWGSSTRALEDARTEAISKTHNSSFNDCFNGVLSLARNEGSQPLNKKVFEIFQKDFIKGVIVVMGIKGNVETTEVGIFFMEHGPQMTKVEISSLSRSAKEKVAEAVFAELDRRFNK
jgi:hypothetical protein